MKLRIKTIFQDIIKGRRDDPPDWYLVGIVGFLSIFGLVALSSAGAAVGWDKFGDSYFYAKHQLLFGFLPGLFLFLLLSRLNYYQLKTLAVPMLLVSIGLLISVFIPGIGSDHGTFAKSWINLFGYSFQPSEAVKLTFLIYLAALFSAKGEKTVQDFNYGFLPFIVVLLVVVSLVLLQPDFGTASIIIAISLAVYFVAGGRLLHLTWLAVAGIGGLAVLIKVSPYRLKRLTTFLHPEFDPQGIGYHINQALLAVGSGGWFGRGFGHSRQKFAYLPEVYGDSIFAVMAEELGFIFSVLVLALFVVLMWRSFRLACRCREPFARLLVAGIVTWLVTQAFLNIGAIIGILPLTGVPLPFISYGGTALTMCLAAAGILVNISRQADNR